MKSFRVWLLLLLIALLPLRGSFAAAVLCHDAGLRGATPVHAHDHAMHDPVDHDHASQAAAGHDHDHDRDHGAADKCNLCSGLTTPACPAGFGAVLALAPSGSSVVSHPTIWPASFVSAGLKRPPRST